MHNNTNVFHAAEGHPRKWLSWQRLPCVYFITMGNKPQTHCQACSWPALRTQGAAAPVLLVAPARGQFSQTLPSLPAAQWVTRSPRAAPSTLGQLASPSSRPPEPPSLSPVCCLLDTCLEVICDLRILSQFCHAPPCPQGTAPPPPPRPKPALPCLRCRPWLGPTASCHVVPPGRDTVASDTCGGREGQERSLSCLLSSRLVSYRPTLRTSGPRGRRSFLRM